ncbi:MAG: SCP2 sterol-binding domain-containing protein [Anaerolineae bacterium]|jgi:putative sterol carrier protein
MSEVKKLIEAMPTAFRPEKAGGAKAVIQLDLTGEHGGMWVLHVEDGACHVLSEPPSSPGVKVTMDADDFVALYRGNLDPIKAFMTGKVKIAGNVGLVAQMLQWFETGQ